MPISKGALAARKLLEEIGIEDPTTIPVEAFIWGRGALLKYSPIKNADGRIVFGKTKAIITINSNIQYEGRKRFTIAHELGHYEMHKNIFQHHNDDVYTLDSFNNSGNQETEANQFASELLMPEELFRKECEGKPFSPDLLRHLSERFQTSLTSATYKYLELGPHPICLVYSCGNKVRYWKKSEDFNHYITDITKLHPPEDSVAAEYFNEGTIYTRKESKQPIWKSTWFELKEWEDDNSFKFYEYCIITPKYNTVLSVIWQE